MNTGSKSRIKMFGGPPKTTSVPYEWHSNRGEWALLFLTLPSFYSNFLPSDNQQIWTVLDLVGPHCPFVRYPPCKHLPVGLWCGVWCLQHFQRGKMCPIWAKQTPQNPKSSYIHIYSSPMITTIAKNAQKHRGWVKNYTKKRKKGPKNANKMQYFITMSVTLFKIGWNDRTELTPVSEGSFVNCLLLQSI